MKKGALLETFGLQDPYTGFEPLANSELWGWNGERPFFGQLVERIRPSLIIEVGGWVGLSTLNMAYALKRNGLTESSLICIDTWLGSKEHWTDPELRKTLELEHGFPTLYRRFLSNVIKWKCEDVILPLPMTSLSAARYLKEYDIKAELIYVDGSHDEKDVYEDLLAYWPLLLEGGIIFGDDWSWDSVSRAVLKFCSEMHIEYVIADEHFWTIQKPAAPRSV
jgi:hypothetical protein